MAPIAGRRVGSYTCADAFSALVNLKGWGLRTVINDGVDRLAADGCRFLCSQAI